VASIVTLETPDAVEAEGGAVLASAVIGAVETDTSSSASAGAAATTRPAAPATAPATRPTGAAP
jgi:hypothetical protein